MWFIDVLVYELCCLTSFSSPRAVFGDGSGFSKMMLYRVKDVRHSL